MRCGAGVQHDELNLLISRADPQMESGDCRGALCSRSGRQRWTGHRCTWVKDECQSDSEKRKKNKRRIYFFSYFGKQMSHNPARDVA